MTQRLTRRNFLKAAGRTAAAASVTGGGLLLKGCSTKLDYDLVIKDGVVLDGLGNPGKPADVGISGNLIRKIGTIPPGRGRRLIDARGLTVAPGFIDVHDHTDLGLIANPKAESAVRQGVTCVISGQCGSSPFPIADRIFGQVKENAKVQYDVDVTWKDIRGFFGRLSEKGMAVNYGTLVGHGAVRGAAMGLDDRPPTPAELEAMKSLVADTMAAGALGLSSGLEYTPGSFAAKDELVDLCRVVRRLGGVYATHMRDEGDRLIESLEETIDVARTSGVSLQISHFKTAYRRNWDKIGTALSLIEKARQDGLDITCDRYTYIAAATDLDFNFPAWARQGTAEDFLGRLRNRSLEARLRAYVAERESLLGSWDKVLISSVVTDANRKYEGLDVLESARRAGKPPFEFMRDLLLEEKDQVGMVLFIMTEDNLKRILAHPLVGIGSDGSIRAPTGVLGRGKPHPRVYGTFARALGKYVREEKLLTLEEMVKKLTSFPARKFGLTRRGVVQAGHYADLVLFDKDRIIDTATWSDPHRFPVGVEYVLVNGEIVVDRGNHTGRLPGILLRKQAAS